MKRIVEPILAASAWTAFALLAVGVSLAQQQTTPAAEPSACRDGKCQVKATLQGKLRDLNQQRLLLEVAVESQTQAGCPILDKIPYVGRLFRNVGKASQNVVLQIPRALVESIVSEDSTPQEDQPAKQEFVLPPGESGESPGLVLEIEDDIRFFTPYFGATQASAIRPLPEVACENADEAVPAWEPVSSDPACCALQTAAGTCCEEKCCALRTDEAECCAEKCCAEKCAAEKCGAEKCGAEKCGAGQATCKCCDGKCVAVITGVPGRQAKFFFRGLVVKNSNDQADKSCECDVVICQGHRCESGECAALGSAPRAQDCKRGSVQPYGVNPPPPVTGDPLAAASERFYEECPAPHQPGPPIYQPGPPIYQPGPPIYQPAGLPPHQPGPPPAHHPPMFQELLKLATENARLKAEHQAQQQLLGCKEQFLRELFQAQRAQAELQARLAAANERQELLESVMDLVAENAKLATVAELTQEHVEMLVRMSKLEAQTPSPQISALEESHQENVLLRARIEQLEQRIAEIAKKKVQAAPNLR